MAGPGRRAFAVATIVAVGMLLGGALTFSDHPCGRPASEIFRGVTYRCEHLTMTQEGSGLLHLVRVDLTAPAIELYVTPLELSAVAKGWQYRLRTIRDVLNKERLAVAINATYFSSESWGWLRLRGDFARSLQTVVANHVVSHLWERTLLLSFDDQLLPSFGVSRPPTPFELANARWGIGVWGVGLLEGVVSENDRKPDSRTAVAIDREHRLLFLAVGENISPRLILQKLADFGAKDGALLDGGISSAVAIGRNSSGVRSGILHGGWTPVATYFGVKAQRANAR
jgi:hypothetical protein